MGIAIALLATLTLGAFLPTRWHDASALSCPTRTQTIYVTGDWVHTNFVVPIQSDEFDWRLHLPMTQVGKEQRHDYQYLVFGWGDRDFYLNTPTLADVRLPRIFQAFWGSKASVLHVQAWRSLPDPATTSIHCLKLTPTHYLQLMNFLDRSFQRDQQGNKIFVSDGHRPYSSFFAAKGRYSLFRTCNVWTAEGLRSAEVNTPVWAGLAPAVLHHLQRSCQCIDQSLGQKQSANSKSRSRPSLQTPTANALSIDSFEG